LPVRALARTPLSDSIARLAGATDRVVVLIQLQGGNDGINTIIPLRSIICLHCGAATSGACGE
jgi:hypothetical protein